MSVFVPSTIETRVKKLEAEIKILKRHVNELRRDARGPKVEIAEEEDESCTIS